MDKQTETDPEEKKPGPGRVLPEVKTLSFIVKIWVEELDEQGEEATWRGSVTHVGSGERHYVKNLEEITENIRLYLISLVA